MWITPFFEGLALSASLIIAIGSQNAFVLTQALKGNHALLIALVCIILDGLLIFSGVYGLGALINKNPQFVIAATWMGIAFLMFYGFLAFKRAASPGHILIGESKMLSVKASIGTTLAISLLNPHVYLDTVVLLGSIGGQYQGSGAFYFALGAFVASMLWFLSLSLTGKGLAPYLREDKHWQRLDMLIGLIMWLAAFSLYQSMA